MMYSVFLLFLRNFQGIKSMDRFYPAVDSRKTSVKSGIGDMGYGIWDLTSHISNLTSQLHLRIQAEPGITRTVQQ
jgi:hypothetical protein